jgi:hypothetical protein
MGPTVSMKGRASQVLGLGMMAAAVIGLVSLARGGLAPLLAFAAPMVLFGLLGWAGFWRPHVEVSDGGVTVVNTLRTVVVPWPAVQSVDGRYGLTIATAYGPVTAWGATAPAGRQRARGEQSAAAAAVVERLECLRAAGHLDEARLERPDLQRTWHWPVILTAALLAVTTVVLPLV